MEHTAVMGGFYVGLGVIGFVCNAATFYMIVSRRVFRLSAYTIMANVALADSIMMVVAGLCGLSILLPFDQRSNTSVSAMPQHLHLPVAIIKPLASMHDEHHGESRFLQVSTILRAYRFRRSVLPTPEELLAASMRSMQSSGELNTFPVFRTFSSSMAFVEIMSWTAGVVSYAYLGLNRCVAICFYGTKARAYNRVSIAIIASISTWVIGIAAACAGTFPYILEDSRLDLWPISFYTATSDRPAPFAIVLLLVNGTSVLTQWVCSSLVLRKIQQIKRKISSKKLNENSANRFRKQARLSFQFFYPSVLCTVTSLIYFAKPYLWSILGTAQIVVLHAIWLCNHMCNPIIYAYFNERMRTTYKDMLLCGSLCRVVRRRRKRRAFKRGTSKNVSRRSVRRRSQQMSIRSTKSTRNGVIRSSLQMQSRDFEQLCEFMMRVNPLYDSSEGWRETSEDESCHQPLETRSEALHQHRDSRSIVIDLGRQTVEHWARFAKKASI